MASRISRYLVPCAVALAMMGGVPTPSQASDGSDLSEAELEALFQTQRTRGLVLAPTGGGDAPAQGASGQSASGSGGATTAAGADSNYVQFDRDAQVNIQIAFDFDSSALREDQKPRLAALCNVMRDIDIERFRIVGHTDAVGSHAYNQRLSLMRAEEVKRYLVNDCGIADTRLEAVGVGPDFLYDPDDPRSSDNRRVEFQALS